MALAVTSVLAQAGSGDRKTCSDSRGNTPPGVPEGKPGSQLQTEQMQPSPCSLHTPFDLHVPDFRHVNREGWVWVSEYAFWSATLRGHDSSLWVFSLLKS